MDGGKQAQFRVGEWHVDPAGGQITRDGKAIRVEPRVMDVLVYLAGKPGQVVTREELEGSVWPGRVISYDALTGTVKKLRNAFADDAREPHIVETLSKKGYRLVAPVSFYDGYPAKQQSSETAAAATRRRNPWLRTLAGAALVILLASAAALLRLPPSRVATETTDPAAPRSLAVLPFDNLSGDPAQDYFADGMTDDLITKLAREPGLLVIARDSSFFYKREPYDFRHVAGSLRVRYILHGSIRRAGERLWFNARLMDAATGSLLWADRYEGRLSDLLDLQNDVIGNTLSALRIDRNAAEARALRRRQTGSPEAYDYFLHGRNRFFLYASKDENRKARELYRKALDLDPDFALAYAMLAWTYAFEAMNGWSDARQDALTHAHALATHAIGIDRELPVAYFVTGLVHRERGEYAQALEEAEKAIDIDSNYANAHVLLATLLYYTGRPQEGLEKIKRAMQLNPHHPYNYPFHLGQAYFILGRYPEAIEAFEQGLGTNPSSERMRAWLAAAYAQAGRTEDARWEAEQLLALNPEFSLQRIRQAFPFRGAQEIERFLHGLRVAGITQ
ncbi:MAG: tetratricopeptide repeat protein [Gammaproteobacteria bacterium]|nr:tetratricopeptide repeat protein [Gammaproteobacteria bacterium]